MQFENAVVFPYVLPKIPFSRNPLYEVWSFSGHSLGVASRALLKLITIILLNPDIRKRMLAARPHLYGLRLINYRAI